jgi:PAS domain S-box-containing protein
MNASTRAVASVAAQESGALFRVLAESLPQPIIVLERELRVRWVNPAAASWLHIRNREQLIGRHWSELGLPWPAEAAEFRDALAGTPATLPETIRVNAERERRTCRPQLVPLRETGSAVTALLCVIDDLTLSTGSTNEMPALAPASLGAAVTDTQRQAALANAQVGSWHWDFEAGYFAVDSRWCKAMNLDPCAGEDHLERWAREIHPDDVAEHRRRRGEVESGRSDRFESEYRILTGDSRWLWVLQRGRIVEQRPDGRAARVTGICIDIDDRKRAEVALQENESRLATALWGARAAFWQWHIPTDTVAMSPLWYAMTGYSREQWESLSNPWAERVHPDDRERVTTAISSHLRGDAHSIELEYRVRTAAGEYKWILMRGRVVEWDFDGRPTSALGVSLDIDAQKRAEVALQSSEARLETAVWGAGMGLWELDFRTEQTRWFSDWCVRLDIDPCDGRDHVARWDANLHPDDVGEAARRFADHVAGKEDYYDAEYRVRTRSGEWRWLFERGRVVERAPDGHALRMVGVCVDIDSRKEAEILAAKSQRRLEVALESARGGMWDLDVATGRMRQTGYFYRMLGVTPAEDGDGSCVWRSCMHPDDFANVRDAVNAVLEGQTDLYESEYRLQHSDGTWRWVLDRGRAAERGQDGKATRLVGFMVDITDRVQTQEALRRSEFRYRTVAQLSPGYVFEYQFLEDGKPRPVWVSEGVQSIFGITFPEIQARGGFDAFIEPEFMPQVRARRERVVRGEPTVGEVIVRTASGERKWVQVHSMPVRDPATGRVTGVIGASHDITTRKVADEKLRSSEAKLRAVTESSSDWLGLFDRDRKCVFLNRRIAGREPPEWVGRAVEEFVQAHDGDRLRSIFEHVIATGEPVDFEHLHVGRSGRRQTFQARVRPVRADEGIVGAVVNMTDITESQAAQIALRTQARILETMREGVVLVDADNRVRLTNPTFDTMFGYRANELIGESVTPLLGSAPASREFECSRRDGTRFMASCVVTPLRMGGVDHWLAVLNDVTERKRLEREIIEIANREQQRIGSDLHDGLGQDLTGIALMLRGIVAQLRKEGSATRLDVEDVINLVNNAIESTRALARGLSPVSTEQGGLAAALQTLAARAAERYGIRVDFRAHFVAPLQLAETAATHLYRIAQEALTNVVRHSRASEVTIELGRSGDSLELRVADNGRGFTQTTDEGSGLGLKIMRYRAQMLGGDLVLETRPDGGATVRCTCPLPSDTSTGSTSSRHRRPAQ